MVRQGTHMRCDCAGLIDVCPFLLCVPLPRYHYYLEMGVNEDKHIAPFRCIALVRGCRALAAGGGGGRARKADVVPAETYSWLVLETLAVGYGAQTVSLPVSTKPLDLPPTSPHPLPLPPPMCVPPFPCREEWAANVLSLVPLAPPRGVSQQYYDSLLHSALQEMHDDYVNSMKRAIINYVVL